MSLSQQSGADGLKRKLSSLEPSRAEDIAWTTARCNRLLRTINSRIEAIRNLVRPEFRAQSAASKPQTKARKQKPESLTDPVWLPNGAKRTKSRIYGRPKVSRAVRSAQPSSDGQVHAILLPSPFLKRVQNPDTLPASKSPAQNVTTPTVIRSRARKQVPVKIEDPIRRAEFALSSAFRTFLSTTHAVEATSSQPPCRGARGLLGICLRQIPQHLESQNVPLDGVEDTVEAVASDVWSFFDDLLDVKGTGWQGLREVSRDQGIDAVRCAILDHSLSDLCVERLIKDCEEHCALPEAEILLGAWLEADDVAVSWAKLSLLDSIALRNNADKMRFRILTRFASQDWSRVTAILNASRNLWNTLLKAIVQDAQDEALNFLHLCIESHTADVPPAKDADATSRRLTRNLDEVVSKLCVMACIDESSVHGAQLREALSRLSMSLLISEHTHVSRNVVVWTVVLTALTGGRVATSLAISKDYEGAARNALDRRTAERRAQDFALHFASDLFSLGAARELDIVSSAFTKIKQHIKQCPRTATARILRAVATELLTRRRLDRVSVNGKDDEDSIWQIPETPSAFQTPRTKRSRYGWDDDLCEWVARTPFTKDVPSDGMRFESNDKENHEPETPDILTRTTVKDRHQVKSSTGLAAPYQRAQCCMLASKSPQVIIARAAKRRKSDRIKEKDIVVESSEDELAA